LFFFFASIVAIIGKQIAIITMTMEAKATMVTMIGKQFAKAKPTIAFGLLI
jgi:hypothetical protein